MNKNNFDYTWGKGLVKFNALSPNNRFYYRIQEPIDKYWGLYVARIAFFDIANRLIYHNHEVFADPIQRSPDDSIKYATFSIDENLVYLRERGENIKQLNHVLLDLDKEIYKILPWRESEDRHEFEGLEKGFFISDAINNFDKVEWRTNKKDLLQVKTLLGIDKWYPIIR